MTRGRRPAALVLAATAAFMLAGCSKAGNMTCQDFNAEGIAKQGQTLDDLLSEHGLDTTSSDNILGVTGAVSRLCASGNPSAHLNDAANWDSKTW